MVLGHVYEQFPINFRQNSEVLEKTNGIKMLLQDVQLMECLIMTL